MPPPRRAAGLCSSAEVPRSPGVSELTSCPDLPVLSLLLLLCLEP